MAAIGARPLQQLPTLSSSGSAPTLSHSRPSSQGAMPSRSVSQSPSGSRLPSTANNSANKTWTSMTRDVAKVTLPMAATFHVPWKQFHVSVKAGTRTLADRLVDRERDVEIDYKPLADTRGGSISSFSDSRSSRRAATPSKYDVSPRAEEMLKEKEKVQRLFSPAPLGVDDVPKSRKGEDSLLGRTKSGAKIYKPTARSSLTITKGCRLAQLIESGCIGLVRSSYFEDCLLHNRQLSMRQLIPNSFMWRGDEAVNLWWKHGKCFLMVVSYSWLSKDHPDPNQVHLVKLVRILEEYKKIWGLHDVAVILDYCSLWQRGAKVDTRTSEQKEQYNYGLRELNVAYAHKSITAVKLTAVPKEETRKYEDRGWTLMEEILIDSKVGDWNRWTFGELDPESTQWTDAVVFFMQAKLTKLRPPLSPERFVQELESRRHKARSLDVPLFSNEKDNEEVPKLYEDIYIQLIHSTKLSYESADWSDEEALLLLEVVAKCDRLEKLNLANNRINCLSAYQIAKLIPHLSSLKYLTLSGNPLCKDSQATDLLRLVWAREKKPARNLII